MKLIISLFSIFIIAQQCNDTNDKKATNTNVQDAIEITYEASSRGFYEKIILSKKQIQVTKDRNGNATISKDCDPEDWNEIMLLLNKIDSEKIKSDKTLNDDIARDAAIPATFTIQYKDNTVSSNTFGHGNPPNALKPLVDKVLSMAKAIDKP